MSATEGIPSYPSIPQRPAPPDLSSMHHVDAMEQLRTDPARRDELGRLGYESAVSRWSEEPHLEAYFALIEEARSLRMQRNSHMKSMERLSRV